ncbi:helix-turn-helix domain-containing protein [Micromonospora sp. NBC_01412]|uniref:helix-turn-helix domain-containing protein n=1 Tax=Micromonospora sp. NBC_01412 TaxID=2903590 RepID=UPI00324D1BDE
MDPQGLSDVKRALGRRLGTWRRKRGLTQDDVARLVHSTRSTVANVESGRQVVDRVFWAQCESLLQAGGELLIGYDEYRSLDARHQKEKAEAARHARWGALASLGPASGVVVGHREEVVEPVAEVQARVRDQHAYVLDESFLGAVEAFVAEVVDSYELRGRGSSRRSWSESGGVFSRC